MIDGARIGVVAIGRNEGERLRRCLESVIDRAEAVVYVDSGSTDDSVAMARSLGVDVVELDTARPFTAARGRNEGFEQLRKSGADVEFVQFVDGDCELDPGWLEAAAHALRAEPKLSSVCGRRRERYPEASVYNRLCDMEWNTPCGRAAATGGDFMIRSAAFQEVGGLDASLIAGEEPDMAFRLRARGWEIERLDAEMTLHDADMHHFSQYWQRMIRSGYAYAEGAARHGRSPERYNVRESLRIWLWALIVPAAIALLAAPTGGLSLLGLLLYPLQAWRIAQGRIARGDAPLQGLEYALFVSVGRFAQLQGQLRYWRGRLLGRRSTLIEYKGAS